MPITLTLITRSVRLVRTALYCGIALLALNLGWYGFHDLARSQPARRAFDLGPNEMTPIHTVEHGRYTARHSPPPGDPRG